MPAKTALAACFPEVDFGGYSRVDGTVAFYSRAQALASGAETVLLVGCGRGKSVEDKCEYRRELQHFQAEGRRVIGIDVDPDAATNPVVDEFALIKPEDDWRWPVESGSVDFVCSDFVLEHVEDPAAFFGELNRVLKPGAVACFRTPGKWSYVTLIARLVPNHLHDKVISVVQKSRKSEDVFPTVYRANTRGALRRNMPHDQFDLCVMYHRGSPAYFGFSRIAYRVVNLIHSILPSPLFGTLLVFARKLGP